MTLSATSVSVAEAQDVEGLGRKMTTTESHSMKKMRTHKLWGDFVEDVRMLSKNGATTADFVEVRLLCGIPYVRKQLYCEVSVGATAGEPWDLLMDYRFASKVNLEQGQIYLGRELVRGEDGTVPERHAHVKAPSPQRSSTNLLYLMLVFTIRVPSIVCKRLHRYCWDWL